MRAAVAQHAADRVRRFAVEFVVDRNRVQESLNTLRRIQPGKPVELATSQVQVLAAGEPSTEQETHSAMIVSATEATILDPCERSSHDIAQEKYCKYNSLRLLVEVKLHIGNGRCADDHSMPSLTIA
jgi:hypothetical protein